MSATWQSTGPDASGQGSASAQPSAPSARRRKGHRGGKKKKRPRRKSFASPQDDDMAPDDASRPPGDAGDAFYAMAGTNLSNASLDSQALLDHREQPPFIQPRRLSTLLQASSLPPGPSSPTASRRRSGYHDETALDDEEDDEGAPLLSTSIHRRSEPAAAFPRYGSNDAQQSPPPRNRRESSLASSRRRPLSQFAPSAGNYNVNYPPSVPGSPSMRMDMSLGDVMLGDDFDLDQRSPRGGSPVRNDSGGATQPYTPSALERRHTIARQAQEDVCFPQEGLSEIADEDLRARDRLSRTRRAGGGRRKWPDLAILEEWSSLEKEGRSEEHRAKKITEPQLVNGRLRPVHKGWFRTEEVSPYRFTYFNDQFQSTIHSQTISELVQPGSSFRELFVPDPPLLSDSSDDDDDGYDDADDEYYRHRPPSSRGPTRQPSTTPMMAEQQSQHHQRYGTESTLFPDSRQGSGGWTPTDAKSPLRGRSPGTKTGAKSSETAATAATETPRYGERPVWWLDVLSPTEAEMKVISKAFGIHPLTAEDIMVQEPREKVELFRHYYFVNYRTFEQDRSSADFLEPVNMYVVVFREGVLSFHFSISPHPANVRRRVRQLRDYLFLSSDWISYAIIDDVTDVFVPLIQAIEEEVDAIDDDILQLSSGTTPTSSDPSEPPAEDKEGDMLRRVGDCRKRVMSLYRLLGNKADVIKGFAKRCNAHFEVAPRSDIGLYLGDIQDHIVTMTGNLSHYEKILARCHSSYIAQINIRMNERQERTADVLGKLTVLGTIVLPMNIITGLWGMNVWVPGQEYEGDLKWFAAITVGLLIFGLACYWTAKRVYRIV